MGSAMAMIWLRRVGSAETGEAIVFHFMVFGSLAMAVFCIPVWHTPDGSSALFLLLTGCCGGLAQLAMTRAYQLGEAARVSAVGYSQIVFARGLAVPVFAELPAPMQILGSVLVIGSGVAAALVGKGSSVAPVGHVPEVVARELGAADARRARASAEREGELRP
jgi:drug/metabolite transporter (DMT)-like permease